MEIYLHSLDALSHVFPNKVRQPDQQLLEVVVVVDIYCIDLTYSWLTVAKMGHERRVKVLDDCSVYRLDNPGDRWIPIVTTVHNDSDAAIKEKVKDSN